MKREGRQHGTVRTHNKSFFNPVAAGRLVDSSSPAGLHTRVPSIPTSHSKYTGKCRRVRCAGCHCHPVSKSRDKAKGARKLRWHDVSLNHRLVSWRVVDSGGEGWWPGGTGAGTSATGMLGYLSDYRWDEGDGGDVAYEEDEEGVLRDPFAISYDLDVGYGYVEQGEQQEIHEEEEEEMEGGGIEVDDDDDDMGFCEVGYVWEYMDEEDWCVVGEM